MNRRGAEGVEEDGVRGIGGGGVGREGGRSRRGRVRGRCLLRLHIHETRHAEDSFHRASILDGYYVMLTWQT